MCLFNIDSYLFCFIVLVFLYDLHVFYGYFLNSFDFFYYFHLNFYYTALYGKVSRLYSYRKDLLLFLNMFSYTFVWMMVKHFVPFILE